MKEINDSFYTTTSMSAGVVTGMSSKQPQADLRVNDSFYLHNFKGIRNLGFYFDQEDEKKLGGDILGFNKYANL